MLGIKIFNKPEPEKTTVLMLDMRVLDTGALEVFARDKVGGLVPFGILWRLLPSGRQHCIGSITEDLGLDLDAAGRIRDA